MRFDSRNWALEVDAALPSLSLIGSRNLHILKAPNDKTEEAGSDSSILADTL
jgi:hypothetical protein